MQAQAKREFANLASRYQIEGMDTVDAVRRQNLGLLVAEARSVKALAERIGTSESQLSQWINASPDSKTGKPRGMRSESCRRIELACEKPTGWMDVAHDADSGGGPSGVAPPPRPGGGSQGEPSHADSRPNEPISAGRGLKVSEIVKTLGAGIVETVPEQDGVDLGFVEMHEDAYGLLAIRVRGDGLSPAVEDGEFLIVSSEACTPGDRVLLLLKDGTKMCKRLLFERADALAVSDLATKELSTIERQSVVSMSPVTAVYSANRWRASVMLPSGADAWSPRDENLGGISKVGDLDEAPITRINLHGKTR